jgi:hypothetical protein
VTAPKVHRAKSELVLARKMRSGSAATISVMRLSANSPRLGGAACTVNSSKAAAPVLCGKDAEGGEARGDARAAGAEEKSAKSSSAAPSAVSLCALLAGTVAAVAAAAAAAAGEEAAVEADWSQSSSPASFEGTLSMVCCFLFVASAAIVLCLPLAAAGTELPPPLEKKSTVDGDTSLTPDKQGTRTAQTAHTRHNEGTSGNDAPKLFGAATSSASLRSFCFSEA